MLVAATVTNGVEAGADTGAEGRREAGAGVEGGEREVAVTAATGAGAVQKENRK